MHVHHVHVWEMICSLMQIMIVIKICTISIKLFAFIMHWDTFSNSFTFIYDTVALYRVSTLSYRDFVKACSKHMYTSGIHACIITVYMTNVLADLPKLPNYKNNTGTGLVLSLNHQIFPPPCTVCILSCNVLFSLDWFLWPGTRGVPASVHGPDYIVDTHTLDTSPTSLAAVTIPTPFPPPHVLLLHCFHSHKGTVDYN